jgi:hypothetical protein
MPVVVTGQAVVFMIFVVGAVCLKRGDQLQKWMMIEVKNLEK